MILAKLCCWRRGPYLQHSSRSQASICSRRASMVRSASGILRRRLCLRNTGATKVGHPHFCLQLAFDELIFVIACCLDVEWLSEDIFASAGADAKIQIMRLGTEDPIRTLRCTVRSYPCLVLSLIPSTQRAY